MKVNQKDLVLISYPFSDLETKKVRPALILSNDIFNKKSDDCIAVPLTSIIKQEPYSVLIDKGDLESGRLLKISRIRVDKIFSIEKDLIEMKIGKIHQEIFNKVKQEFFKLI